MLVHCIAKTSKETQKSENTILQNLISFEIHLRQFILLFKIFPLNLILKSKHLRWWLIIDNKSKNVMNYLYSKLHSKFKYIFRLLIVFPVLSPVEPINKMYMNSIGKYYSRTKIGEICVWLCLKISCTLL